ncbi:MAG: 50S ribosomal protein L18 [candidate division KSB1 bacterium]|nr:50S ribosomal protein L18 [candidate division KSB1 bacterium]MDZ7338218.1 50S ribosomal protein L18 [candidate division KSB1 bacterium]MDZ7384540.1 50S ribosomal protein L18 [candidate division KSB1 bacterium]MDZ7392837.1 50S ribosomal protein L18 [candidate division KSB1 bacterium]MDZ7412571.1 50S ribosomal protein L18 [candidate division KSB1 bacterium]
MKKANLKAEARARKKKRIRKRIYGTPERPRLVVFRSNRHIYAQLVDDTTHRVLTGVSSLTEALRPALREAKSKVEVAKVVGKGIADKAKALNISKVVFDRGGYLYHGRVKALADGAREGGLQF